MLKHVNPGINFILAGDANINMETQGPRITKIILKKEEQKVEDSHFLGYYKATVIKAVWHQHNNRHIDQYNRIKRPEMNTFIVNRFFTRLENNSMEERIIFSISGAGPTE